METPENRSLIEPDKFSVFSPKFPFRIITPFAMIGFLGLLIAPRGANLELAPNAAKAIAAVSCLILRERSKMKKIFHTMQMEDPNCLEKALRCAIESGGDANAGALCIANELGIQL